MLLTLGAMFTSHAPTTEVLVETFILAPAFAALGGYLSTLGATRAPVLAE
jgi:hypothetical protein